MVEQFNTYVTIEERLAAEVRFTIDIIKKLIIPVSPEDKREGLEVIHKVLCGMNINLLYGSNKRKQECIEELLSGLYITKDNKSDILKQINDNELWARFAVLSSTKALLGSLGIGIVIMDSIVETLSHTLPAQTAM